MWSIYVLKSGLVSVGSANQTDKKRKVFDTKQEAESVAKKINQLHRAYNSYIDDIQGVHKPLVHAQY